MSHARTLLALLALAITPLALPSTACAQPTPEQIAEGRIHFDRGVILFDQANHDGALVEFQRAWELSQRQSVLFNIAATCQALHRYGDAIAALRRFLDLSPSSDRQRRQAERTIRELQELIAYVQLSPSPADASVTLDGRAQTADTDILVGPGTHRFEVTRAGRHSAAGEFTVASGDRRVVRVTLTDMTSSAAPTVAIVDPALEHSATPPVVVTSTPFTPPLQSPPRVVEPDRHPLPPRWFWIATASTGALLLGTIITGSIALSTHADYEALPAGSFRLPELESRGRSFSVAADIFGIATLGAGAVTIWLATRTDFHRARTPSTPAAAPRVLVVPTEGGAAVSAWVRF